MSATPERPADAASSLVLPVPGARRQRRIVEGPFLTTANLVSLLRLPIALAAVMFYLADAWTSAALLMVIAFATDAIDGTIARATGTVSEWGKILDPVADKAIFAILGTMLVAIGRVPLWLLALLVGRDLVVVAGGYRLLGQHGRVPASSVLGKVSTLLLATYMIKQAFWPAQETLALGLDLLGWAAFAALMASSALYAALFALRVMRDA